MHIALLSEKYTPDIGGLAISTERIARLLASAGHHVRVFCPSSGLSPSEKRILADRGIQIIRFGSHKRAEDTLLDWFEIIAEEHKHLPFDVLHAYYLVQAGFVVVYAGKYLNLPSVVSIRGNDIERSPFDPQKFSQVMYTLQNASAVTANARILIDKARAFCDREIDLIHNGIDTDLFKPLKRNEALLEALGLQKEDPILGFAGELREKKGLATLLNAYAQVNKHRSTSILIVGEVRPGEDKSLFDALRSSIPNAKILVTGYVSNQDLPSYYSVMDILVHPSLRDGMPNVLLEAMACEKVVVATPAGGIADVLEDGKNGRIVSINDVNSLSMIIRDLLSDKELRERLGAAARRTIQSKFTIQGELSGNLRVYCKLGLKT